MSDKVTPQRVEAIRELYKHADPNGKPIMAESLIRHLLALIDQQSAENEKLRGVVETAKKVVEAFKDDRVRNVEPYIDALAAALSKGGDDERRG